MERNILEGGTVTIRIQRSVLAVALAVVVGFGGGYGVAKLTASPPPSPALVSEPPATQTPDNATKAVFNIEDYPWAAVDIEGRPVLGSEDAPVTVVEFTDFQCPFCGRHARETMPSVLAHYKSKIRYVIRHFPITSIHPGAAQAAQAARVLWILQHFGHQKVSVLDGGFPRWRDEDRHITQQVTQVKRESFPLELAPRRLATADWILDHLDDPDVVIVDVRPKARYEESHVPGAINIFWKDNLESDDTWKDPQKLLELYEAAGITKDKSIVTYCQGGAHNGLTYLTLKALGYPQVRSYDLAWPEWGSDPSLPVSSGPEPGGVSIQDAVSGPAAVSRQLTKPGEDSGLSTLEAGLIAALAVMMVATVAVVLGFWRALRRRAPGM